MLQYRRDGRVKRPDFLKPHQQLQHLPFRPRREFETCFRAPRRCQFDGRQERVEVALLHDVGALQRCEQPQSAAFNVDELSKKGVDEVNLHSQVMHDVVWLRSYVAQLQIDVVKYDEASDEVVHVEIAVVAHHRPTELIGQGRNLLVRLRITRVVSDAEPVERAPEGLVREYRQHLAAPARRQGARHVAAVARPTQHRRQLAVVDVISAVEDDVRRHVARVERPEEVLEARVERAVFAPVLYGHVEVVVEEVVEVVPVHYHGRVPQLVVGQQVRVRVDERRQARDAHRGLHVRIRSDLQS